jgi:hypothetical protein
MKSYYLAAKLPGVPMRTLFLITLFASTSLLGTSAFAEDDDWLEDDGTEDSEDGDWERMEDDDSDIDMLDDPDEVENKNETEGEEGDEDAALGEGIDLLDEEGETDTLNKDGEDSAKIYRSAQDKAHNLGYEEELIFWGSYLKKYPNSIFDQQINERMDNLSNRAYAEEIDDDRDVPELDAGRKEIRFASPLALEALDPRTRIRAGFEWGFPSYFNLLADFEYQIQRELSAHVGFRRRYTGWNLEFGGKYALIKSTRTRSILTVLMDARLNTGPAYLALRPQLAGGKRFLVPGTKGIDAQFQAGVDWEIRDPRRTFYVGGLNIFVWATEAVGAFVETSWTLKPGPTKGYGNDKPFAFNVLTFGLRFKPQNNPTHIAIGANVPYFNNYWGWHYGAIQGDVVYFPGEE